MSTRSSPGRKRREPNAFFSFRTWRNRARRDGRKSPTRKRGDAFRSATRSRTALSSTRETGPRVFRFVSSRSSRLVAVERILRKKKHSTEARRSGAIPSRRKDLFARELRESRRSKALPLKGVRLDDTLAPRRDTHRLQDDAIGHHITFDSKSKPFFLSSRLWRRRRLLRRLSAFFWRRAPPSRGSRMCLCPPKSCLSYILTRPRPGTPRSRRRVPCTRVRPARRAPGLCPP